MRAVTVVQQLCNSWRTCCMFYCVFYFTCDRSLSVWRAWNESEEHPSRVWTCGSLSWLKRCRSDRYAVEQSPKETSHISMDHTRVANTRRTRCTINQNTCIATCRHEYRGSTQGPIRTYVKVRHNRKLGWLGGVVKSSYFKHHSCNERL